MKNSKILICIIFVLFPLYHYGQHQKADSLKNLIENSENDSLKVMALNELGYFIRDSNPEMTIKYAEDAIEISKKNNFRSGNAYALKNMGLGFYIQGEFIKALENYQHSLAILDTLNDKNGISSLLMNIGNIYYLQGDDVKAIDFFLRSLQVAEEIGDTLRIASAYINVGNVYMNKPETYDKSLDYFTRGLVLSTEINEHNILGIASVNIGEIYYLTENFDSALFYFEKSLRAFEIEGGGNVPYTLNNIGKVYSERNEFELSVSRHLEAFKISESLNDKLQMVQSQIGLGNNYQRMNNFIKALDPYLQAEVTAKEIGALNELQEIYGGLSISFAEGKNFTKAFQYQTLLTQVNYDLYNAENNKKIERLEFAFELDNKQREINDLTKDNLLQEANMKRERLAKNAYLTGFVLIILIAIIIYRNYRNKVKTNQLLDEQNHQIESLLLNILPAETAKELQKEGYATPRYYESVSVLFTDFKGFTKIAEGLKPHELVAELNSFFNAFDDIVEKFHLEKIKTIGDAYMCAGGIPVANQTHPQRIVKAGLAMQKIMDQKNEQKIKQGKQPWELRVGIHTGPIVAGVVGKKKYAYDIWGDTVNIASRMESNGRVGRVNISAATFGLIKDKFECSYRGKIEAKNKGQIDMYFLEKEILVA